MGAPTLIEAVNHLREHFGLTMAETISVLRTPLHPRELRDEFAMAALSGAIGTWVLTPEDAACAAYAFADAMLGARNANR